jgi:hypothetical protein
MIGSPDLGLKRMRNFRVRIGIQEGTEDEKESLHEGQDRLSATPGGERCLGSEDHPQDGASILSTIFWWSIGWDEGYVLSMPFLLKISVFFVGF